VNGDELDSVTMQKIYQHNEETHKTEEQTPNQDMKRYHELS
jgi:hypothetical protein